MGKIYSVEIKKWFEVMKSFGFWSNYSETNRKAIIFVHKTELEDKKSGYGIMTNLLTSYPGKIRHFIFQTIEIIGN